MPPPPVTGIDRSPIRRLPPSGWWALIGGNVAVGIVAGLLWPFVYIMGYVIAAAAGWTTGDPTLTDDGISIPIVLGAICLALILGAFLALNIPLTRRRRPPVVQRLPAALVVALVAAIVTIRQVWP
jgi:hypothetical protein